MATHTVVISQKKLSPDALCRAIYGIGIQEMAKEIARNKDGKYDKLYTGRQAGKQSTRSNEV